MKKIISCVLFFIAASVYSFDFMAHVYGGFDLITADTNEHREAFMGGLNSGKGLIEVSESIGSFGAWLRLGYEFEKDWFGDFDIWWRQSEKFAFYITYNDDGHFPMDKIVGWNFYGLSGDVLGLEGCAWNGAFYPGFKRGAFIQLNPMDKLEINWGLNMFTPDTIEFMFKTMTIQLAFLASEKTTIAITYEGNDITEESLDDNPVLSFYLNTLNKKDVEFDIGLSFKFIEKRDTNNDKEVHTRAHPINLGFGAIFPGEKVKVKSRLSLSFLGYDEYYDKDKDQDEKSHGPFDIGIDILPSYVFKENITGYLNAGMYFSFPYRGDTDFVWCLNPYVVIGNEDAAAFFAGLSLYNTEIDQDVLHFTISIGLSFKFEQTNRNQMIRR